MDLYTIRKELKYNRKTIFDLNLKVAYYARVSTDKDEQLHSLSVQQKHFEDLIFNNKNWEFTRGYIDEGLSATTTKNRKNFLEMIKDAKLKRFDLLLTKEISRFARNTIDSLQYTQELLRNGIGIYFENDNINTFDSDSELRLTIMSSIAQDETRKISERVRFGFKESIKKGVVLGNNSIWGYRKENGKLVIVPNEAEMVKEIFDMYANQDMGIRKIAQTLSKKGYKNSNGNPLSFSTVKGILTNPKYKGFYCGNKTHKIDFKESAVKHLDPDQWIMYKDHQAVPQIVSEAIWDKANKILAEKSSKITGSNRTSYQNKYIYSGKILCSLHQTFYHHATYKYKSGNKELWQCREFSNGNGCTSPVIYTKELDEIICTIFSHFAQINKDRIIKDLMRIYKASASNTSVSKVLTKSQKTIDIISAKKDKLLEFAINNIISEEEFKSRNELLSKELEIARVQIENAQKDAEKKITFVNNIESLQDYILLEFSNFNALKKNVADSIIDKIIVGKADIKGEIDLTVLTKIRGESFSAHISRNNKTTSVCC